jgi:hypothetical protein
MALEGQPHGQFHHPSRGSDPHQGGIEDLKCQPSDREVETRSVLPCALPGLTTGSNKRMLEREDVSDLVLDLEQRIDELQHMGDAELGTFGWIDWLILILIAIVLPVIAIVAAR